MTHENLASCADKTLIALLQQGQWAAFDELYNRYWEKLYHAAWNVLQDDESSKDVVQEVFTDLWTRRSALQIDQVSAYLYKAVKNQVIMLIRRKKLRDSYLDRFNRILETNAVEESVYRNELEKAFEQSLTTLPPRCREVFYLSRFQCLSNQEIARRLSISVSTVENQINKALKRLRFSLDRLTTLIVCILSQF